LTKDENGELNISRITSPTQEEEVADTTTVSEPFNWKIDVADLNLKNINFKLQSYKNRGSTLEYPQPNMDDLRLDSLNLSLSAVADIASNEYQLYITEFGVKPNLIGFRLIDLSGKFILLKDVVGIVDLNIITDRSNIELDAAASDFTPFNNKL
jgi:hypothetical protein